MSQRKLFSWVVGMVVLMLVSAACSPAPAAEEGATVPPADSDTAAEEAAPSGEAIKIGGLAPLSSPGAVIAGTAMADAFRIAEEQINASGGLLGQPVEIIIEDSQGLPESAVAAMEKLIDLDGVVAVGGAQHSSVALAAMEVAHEREVPIVFGGPWSDDITLSLYPEVFHIAPLNSEIASIRVGFLASLVGEGGKAAIATENTDFGIPAAEYIRDGLAEAGIESEIFSVDIGVQDFAGIIERIRAEEPDVFIILNSGEAGFNLAQQAADAGIGPQDVLTSCGLSAQESNSFWTTVPDGNLCLFERVGPSVQIYTDAAKEFAQIYTESTGKESVETFALQAYDSVMIIAQAIEEAGSTEAADIIAALENITFEGTLGTITFPVNSQNPPEAAGVDNKWWHQHPSPVFTFLQYQEPGQSSEEAPIVYPEEYKSGELIVPGQ